MPGRSGVQGDAEAGRWRTPDGGDPRRRHQRRPGPGVAGEECNYAPEIHAGGGIMTEYYLILLLFQHSRTLQRFSRKRESSAAPPRACVTCRIPGRILGSLPAPRSGSTCRSALSLGSCQMGHSRRSSTSPRQPPTEPARNLPLRVINCSALSPMARNAPVNRALEDGLPASPTYRIQPSSGE